jgi:hypothetical protein
MITSIAILAGLCIAELIFAKLALGKQEIEDYNFMEFFDYQDKIK